MESIFNSALTSLINSEKPDVVFIADRVQNTYLYCSPVENILGYETESFTGTNGIDFFMSLIHPEDYERVIKSYLQMLDKISSDSFDPENLYLHSTIYRMRHADGHFLYFETRDVVIGFDEKGQASRFFGLGFDRSKCVNKEISVLKGGLDLTTLINTAKPVIEQFQNSNKLLTKREKEIVSLLAKGNSSKLIAEKLSISFHTVESHRRAILQKLGVANTAELISMSSQLLE